MRTAERTTRAALVAVALLLALGPSAAAARTSLARRFQEAEARFHRLTQSPSERRRPELWDRAEARFRAIVDAAPGGPLADDATYLLAEVYQERFRVFHRDYDLDRAIGSYEGLVERHPDSPYADDALVRLGEIHYYQQRDPDGALRLYRRVLREYPGGDMADRARTRMAAIEGLFLNSRVSADGRAGADGVRGLPGRPLLASPGAVVGGRTGGGGRNQGRAVSTRGEDLEGARAPDVEIEGEATAPPPPGRGEVVARPPALEEPEAPPLIPAEDYDPRVPRAMGARPEVPESPSRAAPSRPLNPLLEEGPIPLRTPADRLPILTPAGPQSRAGSSEVT